MTDKIAKMNEKQLEAYHKCAEKYNTFLREDGFIGRNMRRSFPSVNIEIEEDGISIYCPEAYDWIYNDLHHQFVMAQHNLPEEERKTWEELQEHTKKIMDKINILQVRAWCGIDCVNAEWKFNLLADFCEYEDETCRILSDITCDYIMDEYFQYQNDEEEEEE